MKKILIYITLLLITSTAVAQNYPVQSNVNITPPYSVYLSDYASMTSNKLLVTLMLKDVNQSDIQVKLRLTIKGNGIEIRTKADYLPQPLLLQGGAPLLISGADLESYLNPANLDFSGITKSEFTKTGKLPEGVYQFIAEAVEYRRNVTVSNPGMTIGWLVLNDPPRWTLPMANSLLTATYPQNIFFSWMPMSTASPNSAFTTEYEFTIVELWPDSRSPGDAINSSIPLYQVTTSNTSLVYGPAEPELTPGRKYVCRLRAYDTEGRDLFKNKGYSELLVFTFGQSCKPSNTIQHQVLGPEDARVNWTSLPGNTQFVLSYAEQNADGTWSNWYHNETLMPTSNIKGLKAEHTYRYQLKAICGTLESEYSEIKQFNTPAPDTTVVECGKDISIPNVDDSPPLPMLKVGDIINVGGFEARVVEVEGANGTFSGKCVVNVKTFGGVRILSEFENISVNESHQVTAGAINSVKGELNIIGLDEIIKEVVDVFDNTETDPNVGDPYQPGDPVTIVIDGQTVTVTGDTTFTTPDGTEVIVTLSGQPPIVTVDGEPTEVTTDKLDFDNPNTVTDDGNLAHAASDTTAYSINYVQFKEFKESDDKTPGFDAYDHGITAYRNEYKDKKVNDQEYIIPWQSVEANGKQARVNMLIDTKVPDSIQTRLKVEMKGMPLSFLASPDGDTIRILNLVGQGNKDQDLITASYIKDDGDEVPVGYLNLMSYEEQPFNLVIVPVDGEFNYTAFDLQKYLNKVYAPAIVSWTVDIADEPLVVEYDEGEANGLNTSRTLVSKFNAEMKAVITAMENRGDYKPDKATYYLFVMNKAENESLNGLMPFNSNYGFLFTGDRPDQTQLFRTVAHELGHGAFKLRHNFDQFSTIEKRSTQNLMDYTNTPETATVLRKFQWDEIISPRLVALGWSEEKYAEGDPLQIIYEKSKILYKKANVKGIFYRKKCSEKIKPVRSYVEEDREVFVYTNNFQKNLIILYKEPGISETQQSRNELGMNLDKLESIPDNELFVNLKTNELINCSAFTAIIKEDFCAINQLTKEFVDELFQAVTSCLESKKNRFHNYSGIGISAEDIKEYNDRLDKIKDWGIDAQIFITGPATTETDKKIVEEEIKTGKDTEIKIWLEAGKNGFYQAGSFVGENAVVIKGKDWTKNESKVVRSLIKFVEDPTIENSIKYSISLCESIADWVHFLAIPEKYWNPEYIDPATGKNGYNPVLFRIFQITELRNPSGIASLFSEIQEQNLKITFAFLCGFYNGLIQTGEGLPDGIAFIFKLIINDDQIWSQLKEQFEQIQLKCGEKHPEVYFPGIAGANGVQIYGYGRCAWDAIVKHFSTGNIYQKTHKYGKLVFDIVSVVVAWSKVGIATKITKGLDFLDAFGLAFKVVKPLAKFINKGFFRCGKKLLQITRIEGKAIFRFFNEAEQQVSGKLRWIEIKDKLGNSYHAGIDGDDIDLIKLKESLDNKFERAVDSKNIIIETDDGFNLAEWGDGSPEGQLVVVKKKLTIIELLEKLDKNVVDDLNKLTPETRTKILNDLTDNPNFQQFVNENPFISKAFTAHKNDLTQLELDQIDELLKSPDIPENAKQWATRGLRLRNMLVVSRQFDNGAALSEIIELYPNSYGRQITLKVTNKETGKILEIVPDYLVRDGGKYKIVDAKYTSKALDDFELQKALTPNQDVVFGWLTDPKYKGKLKIEVRANNDRLGNLQLKQGKTIDPDDLGIEILQSQAGNPKAIEKTIKLK